MAIVKQYQIDGIVVNVADDAYKNRTPQQVQESMRQFSAIALSAYQKKATKKAKSL